MAITSLRKASLQSMEAEIESLLKPIGLKDLSARLAGVTPDTNTRQPLETLPVSAGHSVRATLGLLLRRQPD